MVEMAEGKRGHPPRQTLRATWRGTTRGKILFDCEDGAVLEVLLQPSCYHALWSTMLDYPGDAHLDATAQAQRSSEIPGQSQCPPVRSLNSTSGDV
ncbi:hypothetical protein DL1_03190 [Thioclava dalianensis]|uniref:Uncharacterized protein n=1 Tax=Thioclava dalianensis TaxID=1185766 RepID=A0A074TKX7_9RHOB|nr:hypothetical protein DL1_03190 [Thioclava dalianensis]